jgi:hypothetical protein
VSAVIVKLGQRISATPLATRPSGSPVYGDRGIGGGQDQIGALNPKRNAVGGRLLLDLEERDAARRAVEPDPHLEPARAGVGPLLPHLEVVLRGVVQREELVPRELLGPGHLLPVQLVV